MLFKVGEEGSVREVLQAGGIVGHDIGTPWDEEVGLAVAVLPLVGTSVVAEVGSGLGCARPPKGAGPSLEESY